MRIPSGVTDQVVYFVAVDATDLSTRETGLSTFTVYRARNGAAAAAMTTPTVTEVDATNMPGVYSLLLDEDMTIGSGNDSEEMVFHITHAGMAPVTRTIELYRPKITAGETLTVASGVASANATQISGDSTAADNLETMLDGTGGQTLSLKQLNIVNSAGSAIVATSSGGNGHGMVLTGNGFGSGLSASGGATGHGILGQGGESSGAGIRAVGDAGAGMSLAGASNNPGLVSTGQGSGAGIRAVGGATGNGMELVGGSSSGDGLDCSVTSGAEIDANITGNLSGSVGSVTGNVGGNVTGTIGGLTQAALADFFDTDSGTDYSSAVAGSVVKEIADNAGGSSLTVGDIADAVWDEALSGHTTAGTAGKGLADAGSAGDPWSTEIPGAYSEGTAGYILGTNLDGTVSSRASQTSVDTIDSNVDAILVDTAEIGAAGAGLTAVPWNAAWDAEVQSEVADALAAYDPPTNAEMEARTLAAASYATAANLATVDGVVDAIKAVTDNLPDSGALSSLATAASIDALPTAAENATAVLTTAMTESYSTKGQTKTVAQALYEIAALLGEKAVNDVTVTVKKVDGSTTAATYTLNDATAPTSITRAS